MAECPLDCNRSRVESSIPLGHDFPLFSSCWVVKQYFEHETIELSFGQRVRAFILNRVLSGEHGENGGERMAFTINGHLPLLHRLQQCGLGFRRSAIDFVGQQDVGEDRAPPQVEAGVAMLKTLVPVMSEGIRSGVN